MEAKKKLFEVNIMENKKFVWGLNILAVALIFPFAFVFGMIGSWLIAKVHNTRNWPYQRYGCFSLSIFF